MYKTVTYEPINPIGTVILLTGRGGKAETLVLKYKQFLDKSRLIGIQPIFEWYPMPNGANDQDEAVKGLAESIQKLKDHIDEIKNQYNLTYEEIALIGFSAGAVMAIQIATVFNETFAFVVSHNGAILEPEEIKECSLKTPIMLIHSKNDDCFSWEERYLPMKEALLEKNYNVFLIEKKNDEHAITQEDAYFASCYITEKFNYIEPIRYEHLDDSILF